MRSGQIPVHAQKEKNKLFEMHRMTVLKRRRLP